MDIVYVLLAVVLFLAIAGLIQEHVRKSYDNDTLYRAGVMIEEVDDPNRKEER